MVLNALERIATCALLVLVSDMSTLPFALQFTSGTGTITVFNLVTTAIATTAAATVTATVAR